MLSTYQTPGTELLYLTVLSHWFLTATYEGGIIVPVLQMRKMRLWKADQPEDTQLNLNLGAVSLEPILLILRLYCLLTGAYGFRV